MTALPPEPVVDNRIGGPYQVAQYAVPPQLAGQPVGYAAPAPPRPRVDRGVWVWPLLVLLALSAIGGAIGLFLHDLHAETEIETGQCITDLASITGNNVAALLEHRVPCNQPHEGEVIAVINPPSGLLAEDIGNWPSETCGFRFEDYVGLEAERSELTLQAFPVFTTADNVAGDDALRSALDSGHWKLVCLVETGGTTTGSVRNARR